MLTRGKVILCDSVLNTLSIFISNDTRGHDKVLYIYLFGRVTLQTNAGPTSAAHFSFSGTLIAPSPRTPLKKPLIRMSSFHHEAADDEMPDLFQLTLREANNHMTLLPSESSFVPRTDSLPPRKSKTWNPPCPSRC